MSWLTDILTPPRTQSQIDALAAALMQFPQDQRRNRILFQSWSDEMNSIERTGKLANGRRPTTDDINHLDAAIDAIEQASAIELDVARQIRDAAITAVNQGKLPPEALEQMNLVNRTDSPGLGVVPILILVIWIGAALVLAAIIAVAVIAILRNLHQAQATAQVEIQYVKNTGQMPPPETLPGYRPPGSGGIIENAERAVAMLPMLLVVSLGIFAFSSLKGKR